MPEENLERLDITADQYRNLVYDANEHGGGIVLMKWSKKGSFWGQILKLFRTSLCLCFGSILRLLECFVSRLKVDMFLAKERFGWVDF